MDILTDGFNILIFIIGFGLLIFVHELGHFMAAKWAGIRTEAFAIGFGHPIVAWRKGIGFTLGSGNRRLKERTGRGPRELDDEELKRLGIGETEYSIRWLPLGGFVRMLGQDDLAPASRDSSERSFNSTPVWKRMIVVSAGVIMNLIFAAILFVIAFSIGVRFEAPVIGTVVPGMPASLATGTGDAEGLVGLRDGDRIVTLGQDPVETFIDAQIGVAMARPDEPLEIQVVREGSDTPLTFEMMPEKSEASGLLSVGILPATSTTLAGGDNEEAYEAIKSYLSRDGLWEAGLRPGMKIIGVDGTSVSSVDQFQSLVTASEGVPVSTRWSGQDGEVDIQLSAQPVWPMMRAPAGAESQPGLLGLVPLVKISEVRNGSPNEGILKAGDVVLRIGDAQAPRMSGFRKAIAERGAGEIDLTVIRNGEFVSLKAQVVEQGLFEPRALLNVSIMQAWDIMRVAEPMPTLECDADNQGSLEAVPAPLSQAGIMGGSRILSVNAHPVNDWQELYRQIMEAEGEQVLLNVENPTPGREQRSITLSLADISCGLPLEMAYAMELPFDPIYTTRNSGGNPITAISMGLSETFNLITMTYLTLDRVARGSVSVEQLQGPVGIVHIGTKVIDRGFTYLLFFLALISVNLAVVNFLPLPIVDGGLFLNLVYEKIKGRPPSPGFQNAAAIFGLLLIGSVFIMVTYNDLVRLLG
ncbi:MAG: site-2 protease family protein [Phycisphaerales bacterium]|nr:site-2 protease family protein [Phycisphaerales bacterium]